MKPCPFCGSKSWELVQKLVFSDGQGWRMECVGECSAKTCWWHSKEEAIEAWNRRIKEGGV